ncbi:MAG: LUD domain-containing protein, partial [Sedimenticola sp.]
MQTASDFRQRSEEALNNPQIRRNFRFAMDGLMAKRRIGLSDPVERESLRTHCAGIRVNALEKLPELLEQLEENCTRNGIRVHWAESVDEANGIVLDIMQQHNATRMIKGKSMVSEEMELNHFLEDHGIECLESDLGEYIVQLAGEAPSHIIAPA